MHLQERSARSEVINVMQDLSKRLPMYVWLTALSQLTSRICHPHVETQRITQHILTRVTAQFPHQVNYLFLFNNVCSLTPTERRLSRSPLGLICS